MSRPKKIPAQLPDFKDIVVRILRKRKTSKVVFLTVRALEQTVQVACRKNENEEVYTLFKTLPVGSLVRVSGVWDKTERGTVALFAADAEIVHNYEGRMPDKLHGIADDQRHLSRTLDLVNNESFFNFTLLGADILYCLRKVLNENGFREFNTGVLQRRFEGGLASPFVTVANATGIEYYLSLTSELKLKRLLTAGAERVCEIGQSFRNEGLSRVHSPEFTLLEAYGVDMTYVDFMCLVEEMLIESAGKAGQRTKYKAPFERMTYSQICKEVIGNPFPTLELLTEKYPNQFTAGMPYFTWVMKMLEGIIGPNLGQPTFITRLPAGLSPLVKKSTDDNEVTERAFLFAKGYFICDIYTDENNPEVLERELYKQADALSRAPDPEYLQCIRMGAPPTAGVGLGVNRLHMLFLPEDLPQHIRETILFPLG